MTPETQQYESPYCVKIETGTGQSSTVPIAVLTPKQLEVFLQTEFKRLAQEAGGGARSGPADRAACGPRLGPLPEAGRGRLAGGDP